MNKMKLNKIYNQMNNNNKVINNQINIVKVDLNRILNLYLIQLQILIHLYYKLILKYHYYKQIFLIKSIKIFNLLLINYKLISMTQINKFRLFLKFKFNFNNNLMSRIYKISLIKKYKEIFI